MRLFSAWRLRHVLERTGCRDVWMLFTVDAEGAVHGLVVFWVPKARVARAVLGTLDKK